MLRIGELARRSGVSAKALRLYESSGLLRPDAHSPAGYRLYGQSALRRLSQILLLRRAGFPLKRIADLISDDGAGMRELVDAQIVRLEQQAREAQAALKLMQQLRTHLWTTQSLEQLMECIDMTQKLEIDLSPEERAGFERRAQALGPEALAQAAQAWPPLIAAVRAAQDAGTAPESPEVQALARQWHALVQAATGGDATVGRKIASAWQAQPQAMATMGMDAAMFGYIGQAMRAAGLAPA
jgi:DNA-binding transcriptional MerR regulator